MSDSNNDCADNLLELVFAQKPQLYTAPSGEPFIVIPRGSDGATPQRLRCEATRDWLSKLYWEDTGSTLSEPELGRAIRVLAGAARERPASRSKELQAYHDITKEPCLEILVEFLRTKPEPRYETRMTELLDELKTLAKANGVSLTQARWPKTAGRLGALIRSFQQDLATLGIEVQSDRNAQRRTMIFTLTVPDDHDEPTSKPSLAASLPNPLSDKEEQRGDDHVAYLNDPDFLSELQKFRRTDS